jgi:hypothetical protein
MSPVYRYESAGEAGVSFPTLSQAMACSPSHAECRIATSPHGVVLAEACPVAGSGTCLVWALTNAGRDVDDHAGWTLHAPTLSPEEYETALAFALGDELRRAS